MLAPSHCIDTYGRDEHSQLGLFHCAFDLVDPQVVQFFTLRHFRDIALKSTMFCFDQDEDGGLVSAMCHHSQGNQYFRYDIVTKQIHHGSWYRDECVDMNPDGLINNVIFLSKCDEKSLSQKWNWGYVNETALRSWTDSGTTILDKKELVDLKNKKSSK